MRTLVLINIHYYYMCVRWLLAVRRLLATLLIASGATWALVVIAFTTTHGRAPDVPMVPASVAQPPVTSHQMPFVIVFESGSGSSWLVQELSRTAQVCLVLFEPIDNVTLASRADHQARLRWLETLWTPPKPTESAAAWADWRERVVAASIFGQLPLVRESLARCTPQSVVFGLKARLSRLLTHEDAMAGLRTLLQRLQVRVLRLGRRNRIKQALTEYRRLHAGLGHFRAAHDGAASAAAHAVDLHLFRSSLRAVERSHRLASRVLKSLAPQQPLLELTYEELLNDHEPTMGQLHHFLSLQPMAPPALPLAAAGAAMPSRGTYVKATPDRLCDAVENYAALCRAYRQAYGSCFDEPCDCQSASASRVGMTMRTGRTNTNGESQEQRTKYAPGQQRARPGARAAAT